MNPINVTVPDELAPMLADPAVKTALEASLAETFVAGWEACRKDLQPVLESAADMKAFLTGEVHDVAIVPASWHRPAAAAKAAPTMVAPSDPGTVTVRLELGDGIKITSMPDRVTRRTVDRDAAGVIVGTSDVETDG